MVSYFYEILIVPSYHQTTISPLVRLQKKAIRIMTFNTYDSPSQPLFYKLQILPLQSIYNISLSTIIHKFYNNTLTSPDSLILLSKTHNYSTRLSKNVNYLQNSNRTNLGQQTYLTKGIKIWQTIPSELKSLPTHIFKKKLKLYFLNLINK